MEGFIFGDFESKYDGTYFKKTQGRHPEAIFYSQSGRMLERIGIEDFTR